MSRAISDSERRIRSVVRHHLGSSGPTVEPAESSAVAVTRSLVALHSSDPVSVYLSVLARSPSATVESVSDALYGDRQLARVHGMRRTLWVADIDTAADIVTASGSRLAQAERKRWTNSLAEAGVGDPGAWIDGACAEILAFVTEAGLVDTQTIGEALPHRAVGFEVATGKVYAGTITAHTRILLMLAFEGLIMRTEPRGSWIASQYQWAESESWLGRPLVEGNGEPPNAKRKRTRVASAQAAVIDRYLQAFGPATTDDVVWWTGWPKGAIGKALASLGSIEVDLDGGTGWLSPSDSFDPSSSDHEEVAGAVARPPRTRSVHDGLEAA